MKANRKFVEGEEAVSAVIGVILMVAITVAIAAAVYVYVSGMIGGTTQHTPTISCVVDNDANKLIINSAESGTDWSDIDVTVTSGFSYAVYTNGGTTNSGTNPSGSVTAGDYILLSGGTGNADVTLTYTPTNTLIGTWTVNV